MKRIISLLFGLCLCGAVPAMAVQIQVVPSSQAIIASQTVQIALWVSGLGNYSDPSLGAWDLDLSFDPALASYQSVTFGAYLGASYQESVVSANQITLSEVSLESASYLNATQPDSFQLASVSFLAIANGAFNPQLLYVSLSDQEGYRIPETASTLTLLALAVLGLIGSRRRFS